MSHLGQNQKVSQRANVFRLYPRKRTPICVNEYTPSLAPDQAALPVGPLFIHLRRVAPA